MGLSYNWCMEHQICLRVSLPLTLEIVESWPYLIIFCCSKGYNSKIEISVQDGLEVEKLNSD